MSSLARDAAASKSSLQNANLTPWHSNQASASSQPATPPDSDSGKKKKRPKSSIDHGQRQHN
jgi:hypothetical protein